ncbi:MAG: phosphoglycolate/pyridoxal phosphate family phosphatase [Thermoleophilia bacterium]|nr:phosphoglycolate/pyridoxal phosphate family phosphatase [Thermoleophilia bacterium]
MISAWVIRVFDLPMNKNRAAYLLREPVRVVAVDLDGVVWRGNVPLPGIPEVLVEVVSGGLDLRYVTNNSTAHRETVAMRLAQLGLPAGVERVFTSGFVAARWLSEKLPEGALVMVVGEEGLLRELSEVGFEARHVSEWASGQPSKRAGEQSISRDLPSPRAVVVGMDRSFDYQALSAAQTAIRAGALFVATNTDATFPTPTGLRPGAGSLVAAVATAAERQPEVMGKPGLAFTHILETVTGVGPSQTVFVGDRLETDVLMGKRAGMITVLVLTGVTGRADVGAQEEAGDFHGNMTPDYVIEDLRELPRVLDELHAGRRETRAKRKTSQDVGGKDDNCRKHR